LSINNPKL